MLGVDTVNLRVEAYDLHHGALGQLAALLPREGVNNATGTHWAAGNVENLLVSLNETGLNVVGSLATFLYGNNTQTLARRDVVSALEKLSDNLHADMAKAAVRRVDVSASFQMRHKVQAYLGILGGLNFFSRTNVTKNTLFYQRGEGGKQALCFYDKCREQTDKHHGKDFPQPYKDTGNVLRYEARLLKQIPQQIEESEVTGAMLARADIFRKLAKFWGNSYFLIQKTYDDADYSQIRTPNDARDFLLVQFLNKAGAGALDKYLAEIKNRGVFADRKCYSRLKQQIKAAVCKYSDRCGESLAKELDNCVRTELAYI